MTGDQIDSAEDRARARLQQDRDDLNNEVAGRDTGRIKRFVAPEHFGNGTSKADNDSEFQIYADMALRMEHERQERLQAANENFERINRAYDLAIAESDQKLQEAEKHRQEVYDNGTKISDGRVVFRDGKTGLFHDKDDAVLDKADQEQALKTYKKGDSDRHSWIAARKDYSEETEHLRTLQFGKAKLNQRYHDLETGNITLDEFEADLEELTNDGNLKPYLDDKTEPQVRASSAAKDFDVSEGITSELSLTPAFSHAGGLEQPDQQLSPDHDSRDIKPQNVPGVAPV